MNQRVIQYREVSELKTQAGIKSEIVEKLLSSWGVRVSPMSLVPTKANLAPVQVPGIFMGRNHYTPLERSLKTLIATWSVSQLLRSCRSMSHSDCSRSRRWISVFRCTNSRLEVLVRLPAHSRYVSSVSSRSVPLRRS